MTNELAIRILTGDVLGTTEQTQEAVIMAVRALSQPDFDTIAKIDKACDDGYKQGYLQGKADYERKTGKWILHPEQEKNIFGVKTIECSECGDKCLVQCVEKEKYCRNCGARMER